jgi:hypothetical protein
MPHHGLECLGVRRDVCGIDCRDDNRHVGNLRVYPPSRPTIPRIALPRSFASCSALTKFGLTFFSTLPPPTDNTRIASFALSRLPLSHSTKTDGHPSSFVRAVSSDTLSVGA